MDKKENFDVVVIGGGPAGMMAAAKASGAGLKVALIEKNTTPGKKLLLTGGGRCNLSNAEFDLRKLVKNYRNGEFLFHVFSVFGPKETIEFFERIGVKTKTESNNRVFPKNDSAKEVLEALRKYLQKNNVEIIYGAEVTDVKKTGKKISELILNGGKHSIFSDKYILATGGKSYSLTGSDGFGYQLAKKLGHTIVNPSPALSPIRLKEKWTENLQGISFGNAKLNVFLNNKKQFSEEGQILFTHFGVSGPAALNISGNIEDLLGKGNVKIQLDLSPLLSHEQLLENFKKVLQRFPKKTIKNVLSDFVQERLAEVLLAIAGIDAGKIANNVTKTEREKIIKTVKNFEVAPESVMGFDGAMATQGGIDLKEINHTTMQSKIIDNLFFAGEIIDVNGKTGGFNLQMCWSTGYVSGG